MQTTDAEPAPDSSPIATVDPEGAFVDPEGMYTMEIGDTWVERTGQLPLPESTELWQIGKSEEDGFASNVNVTAREATGDVDDYLQAGTGSMNGLLQVTQKTVTGRDGNDLGVWEYVGVSNSDPKQRAMHYLGVIAVANGHVVIATLATLADDFDTIGPTVEPYLLTLQAA